MQVHGLGSISKAVPLLFSSELEPVFPDIPQLSLDMLGVFLFFKEP